MGGTSKSSNNYTTDHSVTDVKGELAIGGDAKNVTYNYSDAEVLKSLGSGAFNLLGDVHEKNTDLVETIGRDVIESADNKSAQALQLAEKSSNQAMQFVSDYTQREQLGGQSDVLKWVAIGAVGVAGVAFLGSRK